MSYDLLPYLKKYGLSDTTFNIVNESSYIHTLSENVLKELVSSMLEANAKTSQNQKLKDLIKNAEPVLKEKLIAASMSQYISLSKKGKDIDSIISMTFDWPLGLMGIDPIK